MVEEIGKDFMNCFLVVVSSSSDIPKRGDLSSVKYGIAVMSPYLRCLLTMDYIRDQQGNNKRQLRETMPARE